MKTFEITTPALRQAMANFSAATEGAMEHQEALRAISAGNGMVRAVGQELRVRLALPRILAAEAKLIEQDQTRQLAAT